MTRAPYSTLVVPYSPLVDDELDRRGAAALDEVDTLHARLASLDGAAWSRAVGRLWDLLDEADAYTLALLRRRNPRPRGGA